MFYNTNITYSEAGILYQGSLRISVSGISSPILINNIRIIIDPLDDYSNNTSVGIVSFNLTPTGVMSFEVTDFQSQAITQSEIITLNSVSGEVTVSSAQNYLNNSNIEVTNQDLTPVGITSIESL
jgi:hypothetical protein